MDKQTLRKAMCDVTPSNNAEFTLKEKGTDATLREVTIYGLPKDAYAVKIDGIKVSKLFGSKGIGDYNKHGDYLIVTDNEMVVIELKSQKKLKDTLIAECELKFTSDYCIFDYCDAVFSRMLGKKPFFTGKPIYFVLLYQGMPIAKTTTSAKPEQPQASHTDPRRFARLAVANGERVSFGKLLRGA